MDYLNKLKHRVEYLYFLYELNTQISICEPWEKTFINCLFLTILGIVLFACYAYLPGYVRTLMYFITPAGMSERFQNPVDKSTFSEHAAEFVKEF